MSLRVPHLAQWKRSQAETAACTFSEKSQSCSSLPTWGPRTVPWNRTEKALASMEKMNGFLLLQSLVFQHSRKTASSSPQCPQGPVGKSNSLRQCDFCLKVSTTMEKSRQAKPIEDTKGTRGDKHPTFPRALAVWGCEWERVYWPPGVLSQPHAPVCVLWSHTQGINSNSPIRSNTHFHCQTQIFTLPYTQTSSHGLPRYNRRNRLHTINQNLIWRTETWNQKADAGFLVKSKQNIFLIID